MKKKNIIWWIVLIILFIIFFYLLNFWAKKNWIDLNPLWDDSLLWRLKFFIVLVPAAIWDSINPCEFAIMFILLQTVLKTQKSVSKVILVWSSFILAIFLSYLLMWLGLYKALANIENTAILKIVAWSLWIIIWLASLKDYFWYGKWFKLEVPDSWRPTMRKLIKWIASPIWAFFIWILISLFLLPCTSWPYITILWMLSSKSQEIGNWWYIYLLIYNLIFILPMILIMFLVISWKREVSELKELKELNVEIMHLITWIIMIILWIYIFYDLEVTTNYFSNFFK